ncbi:MAG: hypothetical protein HRT53_20740 [Colwellia sp.]|nr:hypothetical protein [Colwellia sp.]
MEVSTSINTNLNQAKVSTEKKQETELLKNVQSESTSLSESDTVNISQEALDANKNEQSILRHAGGGVYVPPTSPPPPKET